MNPEEIFLYTLRVFSTILGSFIAYMVLKYLNKKPLGMQTIFDEIIKDFIYLNMLDWLMYIVSDVSVRFCAPLNHYAISTIMTCHFTVTIGNLNQLSMLMLIRYLFVFYPTRMINAHFAKDFARLFLVYISFTATILIDKKRLPFYYIASGKKIENLFNAETFTIPMPLLITMGVCGMILIFTQYKIEKFIQSVDSLQQDIQGEENQNSFDRYSNNTYRIAVIILFLLFISVILIWHQFYLRLRVTVLKHIILHNVIPIIFIIRNDALFHFMKTQSLKLIKCKCGNNQIEPMIELNVL